MTQTKSVRLNVSIREDIKKHIEMKYQESNPAPVADATEVVNYHYKKTYGDPEILLQSVNNALFCLSKEIILNVGGERRSIQLNNEVPVIPSQSWSKIDLTIPVDCKLWAKYQKNYDALSDWKEEKKQFLREIGELLYSVNTSKQLLELWPEVEPYLPPHVADPSSAVRLPTVVVSRLNERLQGEKNNDNN